MSLHTLKHEIATSLADTFGAQTFDLEKFEVDYASDSKFGDFATNAALVFAKQLKMAPRDVAARLATRLAAKVAGVQQVDIAGPGFINITMTPQYWVGRLKTISAQYAQNDSGKGCKVQVEYISANPTGPLTIGNARGGFIGDVLSNVLEWNGFEVVREYYFNDAGAQITKLVESVKMEAGILPETEDRQYRGAYIRELANRYASDLRHASDSELRTLLTKAVLENYIKPATLAMGIEFDVWFNEIDLISSGLFRDTLARLNAMGLIFERDGATWLKTEDLGDQRKERVIVKSNGDPTYMAPDIAYHVNIFERRKFDYAIKVLGPDHIAQFPSVYAAVHKLFPGKTLKMASYQWLRIIREGKEVKVSKRLGQFITVQDLIDQITMPVARFLTLMRAADSHMDFDLDLAREQSVKNPYYYVMYAYARANSVLDKAAERGLRPSDSLQQLDDRELQLIKQMARMPQLVEIIANDFGVHRLTFYGLEIAKLFTDYYESTRIIDLVPEMASAKLYVVKQFVVFMDVYWKLLGIEPLRKMSH